MPAIGTKIAIDVFTGFGIPSHRHLFYMSIEEEATDRIPGSLSEWFASCPPRSVDSGISSGSDLDRMKHDLEAILEPADEAKLKVTKTSGGGDECFRFEPVDTREKEETE